MPVSSSSTSSTACTSSRSTRTPSFPPLPLAKVHRVADDLSASIWPDVATSCDKPSVVARIRPTLADKRQKAMTTLKSECVRLWYLLGHESLLYVEAFDEKGMQKLTDAELETATEIIIGKLDVGSLKNYLKEVFAFVEWCTTMSKLISEVGPIMICSYLKMSL